MWATRHPRVYRYLEQKYVDDFFATGKLQLSSFERFAAHADEQRLDSKEGKTYLVHRTEENGGQTLLVEADFGNDAYVLCGSVLPSVDLMKRFDCDSAIVIKDPIGFANAIASALKGYVRGIDGPCSYQLRRIVEQDVGWVDLGPEQQTEGLKDFNLPVLQQTLANLVSPDVYFLKNAGYVSQAEWRFVWLVDHYVTGSVIVEAPASRKFCTRWDSQGDVIAFGGNRS